MCASCVYGAGHDGTEKAVIPQPFREDHGQSFGEPGGIRTHDLLIRSQTLYPAELRAHGHRFRQLNQDTTSNGICQAPLTTFFKKDISP